MIAGSRDRKRKKRKRRFGKRRRTRVTYQLLVMMSFGSCIATATVVDDGSRSLGARSIGPPSAATVAVVATDGGGGIHMAGSRPSVPPRGAPTANASEPRRKKGARARDGRAPLPDRGPQERSNANEPDDLADGNTEPSMKRPL